MERDLPNRERRGNRPVVQHVAVVLLLVVHPLGQQALSR